MQKLKSKKKKKSFKNSSKNKTLIKTKSLVNPLPTWDFFYSDLRGKYFTCQPFKKKVYILVLI